MRYGINAPDLAVKRGLACGILAAVLLLGLLIGIAGAEADKPLIAHLYDDPVQYDGRIVTIYGLVIETAKKGREFMLQDVSQMPLRIVRTDRIPAFIGDQMLIKGKFVANGSDPYLMAREITHTKVLGGGGCC